MTNEIKQFRPKLTNKNLVWEDDYDLMIDDRQKISQKLAAHQSESVLNSPSSKSTKDFQASSSLEEIFRPVPTAIREVIKQYLPLFDQQSYPVFSYGNKSKSSTKNHNDKLDNISENETRSRNNEMFGNMVLKNDNQSVSIQSNNDTTSRKGRINMGVDSIGEKRKIDEIYDSVTLFDLCAERILLFDEIMEDLKYLRDMKHDDQLEETDYMDGVDLTIINAASTKKSKVPPSPGPDSTSTSYSVQSTCPAEIVNMLAEKYHLKVSC